MQTKSSDRDAIVWRNPNNDVFCLLVFSTKVFVSLPNCQHLLIVDKSPFHSIRVHMEANEQIAT